MGVNFERFTHIAHNVALLQQYLQEGGVKFPLMQALQQRRDGYNIVTIMDVKYSSYSLNMEFPEDILEVNYTGVSFQFFANRWTEVGDATVKVQIVGRATCALETRARCTEVFKADRLYLSHD